MATHRGNGDDAEFIMNLDYASVEARIIAYCVADAEVVWGLYEERTKPGFAGQMESRFVTNCIDLKPSEWRRV